MSRPEHQAPPEIFYNEEEASKYTSNSHIQAVQAKLTQRALELLLLAQDQACLLLDIGCGSGLSGQSLEEAGHAWIGVDISTDMLGIALQRELAGDLILADIGDRCFDGAISISAIQWLCNADKKSHVPYRRLLCFFKWLYVALKQGSRAVLQFYPENPEQLEMITSAAMRCGFGGGIVVDYPNSTRAKKHFLVIWSGLIGSDCAQLPQALDEEEAHAVHVGRRQQQNRQAQRNRRCVKDREWILHKKSAQRNIGMDVRLDTKYTGRKRKDKF